MKTLAMWEIVKDKIAMTYEIVSEHSTSDEWLNEMVVEMQERGLKVFCEAPTRAAYPSRESISRDMKRIGFTEEPGLWIRLQQEYRKLKPGRITD